MRRGPSHAGSLRVPSHAGGLRLQERVVFALIFMLMAAFVAVVTVKAVRARDSAAVATSSGLSGARISTGTTTATRARPTLNAQLAAALRPEVSTDPGALAVGVIDSRSGSRAVYNANLRFRARTIVTADIAAALLLQHQQAGSPMAGRDARLATEMVEGSSAAARTLWRQVGGAAGVRAANLVLGLPRTRPSEDGRWGLTSTTVGDQLQLLIDLTSAGSPLDATSRGYATRLLQRAAAAADSLQIVRRDGHELLIVVLSRGNPDAAAGVARAAAAAATAALVATAGSQ